MSQNILDTNNNFKKNKKLGKATTIKPESKKKRTKNNFYNSSFKLGIPEHSSEEEEDTTAIKIYFKKKLQQFI